MRFIQIENANTLAISELNDLVFQDVNCDLVLDTLYLKLRDCSADCKVEVYETNDLIGYFECQIHHNIAIITSFKVCLDFEDSGSGVAMLCHIKEWAMVNHCNYIKLLTRANQTCFFKQQGGVVSQTMAWTKQHLMIEEYVLPIVSENWIDLPTAGLVVVKQGKLLLTYSNTKHAWYLPGGKVDQGEDGVTAIHREIEEELSLKLDASRLQYLTHIIAPAYGEQKNILMQQACFLYDLQDDVIEIANEIGGVQYYSFEEYTSTEINVPGVLMVFAFLKRKGLLS